MKFIKKKNINSCLNSTTHFSCIRLSNNENSFAYISENKLNEAVKK